jgi:ribosome biogenesis GTPase
VSPALKNYVYNEINKMKLEDLGYSAFFESNRRALGLDGYEVARVIAEYKEAYRVKNITNEYLAKISGRQMFKAVSREDYPRVGDWVAITERNTEEAVIHRLLPRQTILRRKYSNKSGAQVIGANIDVSFIIESVDRDYNLNRFERYFTMVNEGHIKPAIVLNKIDLIPEAELNLKMSQLKTRFKDINVIPISASTSQGLGGLMAYIERGKTYCFLGSSGVGKSSLINKLLGTDNIKTNTINLITGGGKHTTASRKMYFLENGGMVIDNPGMKEIGMTDANAGIENAFEEITALSLKCKYKGCSHTNETGCAVLAALKSGWLDGDKYSNYARLRKEAKEYKMTELEKGRSGRKFGKSVRKAQQKQTRK